MLALVYLVVCLVALVCRALPVQHEQLVKRAGSSSENGPSIPSAVNRDSSTRRYATLSEIVQAADQGNLQELLEHIRAPETSRPLSTSAHAMADEDDELLEFDTSSLPSHARSRSGTWSDISDIPSDSSHDSQQQPRHRYRELHPSRLVNAQHSGLSPSTRPSLSILQQTRQLSLTDRTNALGISFPRSHPTPHHLLRGSISPQLARLVQSPTPSSLFRPFNEQPLPSQSTHIPLSDPSLHRTHTPPPVVPSFSRIAPGAPRANRIRPLDPELTAPYPAFKKRIDKLYTEEEVCGKGTFTRYYRSGLSNYPCSSSYAEIN